MSVIGDALKVLLRKLTPPLFTIRIRSGDAVLHSGRATAAFVRDCGLIARRSGIRSGWVWGIRSGGQVRLDFTGGIGEGDRQRFRNVLGVHL